MIIDDQIIERILKSMARTKVPEFNRARIRNQILDRIAVPEVVGSGFMGRFAAFTPFLRVGAGVMASLLIVISLTLGTAVVALESVPGSAIYPLKKIVENIELRLTPANQRANLQLKFAGNRADELQEVLEQKQEGKISEQEAEAIVADTVKDLREAAAAVSANKDKPKSSAIVNKLNDISNKLRAASIQSDGQVKIELEKALEATKISQEEAIKNLEQAGLKVEDPPLTIDDNSIKASGKLTEVTENSISIGTAKFSLTVDTTFVDMEAKDLKAGIVVDIEGEIKDNKSYAVKITKVAEIKTEAQTLPTTEETPTE